MTTPTSQYRSSPHPCMVRPHLSCLATWLMVAACVMIYRSPQATAADTGSTLYEGGIGSNWRDYGWAEREVTNKGQSAKIKFHNYAGWQLSSKQPVDGFGRLNFHLKAPASHGSFLEVRLRAEGDDSFPRIQIGPSHISQDNNGWLKISISAKELNPAGIPFHQVVLRAYKQVSADWVELDHFHLSMAQEEASGVIPAKPTRPSALQIDCSKPAKKISPYIYGVAFSPRKNAQDQYLWQLHPTSRRWGGNPTSRYNWQLGNAWNTAADWFYMNLDFMGGNKPGWQVFLQENKAHNVHSALTVPTLGWVAKDTSSYSFPVSVFGPQQQATGSGGDIGNGKTKQGVEIPPGDPKRTSLAFEPNDIVRWLKTIEKQEGNKQALGMVILDNEPMLWNSTHRDVHPEPVGYDELLERTFAYAKAIRAALPHVPIAGPALWGWPAYFYSAKDAAAGFSKKPDRKAHGDIPLLNYYLQKLKAYEQNQGVRLLDIVDVHFYPQGKHIYGRDERNDAETSARRLRSTRALWDPSYKDESWINDWIRLIPRLKSIITETYPGMQISIGEYNFGGERYPSGGLALAEALGRFGQEGVYSAYYWTYPPEHSAAAMAFRAFRNYDGQGSRFQDYSLSTSSDKSTSLFASRNETGEKIVAIMLNLESESDADATLALAGCGLVKQQRSFQLKVGSRQLEPIAAWQAIDHYGASSTHKIKLPYYSLTVTELQLQPNN